MPLWSLSTQNAEETFRQVFAQNWDIEWLACQKQETGEGEQLKASQIVAMKS